MDRLDGPNFVLCTEVIIGFSHLITKIVTVNANEREKGQTGHRNQGRGRGVMASDHQTIISKPWKAIIY